MHSREVWVKVFAGSLHGYLDQVFACGLACNFDWLGCAIAKNTVEDPEERGLRNIDPGVWNMKPKHDYKNCAEDSVASVEDFMVDGSSDRWYGKDA